MRLATIAKWLTLGGGSLQAAALNNAFGKWSTAIGSIGTAAMALGAAMASQTSAGHPNGAV